MASRSPAYPARSASRRRRRCRPPFRRSRTAASATSTSRTYRTPTRRAAGTAGSAPRPWSASSGNLPATEVRGSWLPAPGKPPTDLLGSPVELSEEALLLQALQQALVDDAIRADARDVRVVAQGERVHLLHRLVLEPQVFRKQRHQDIHF